MAGVRLLLVVQILMATEMVKPLKATVFRCEEDNRAVVAFTAVLQPPDTSTRYNGFETMGPYDKRTTLIYHKVITNIGQAYNPATGMFTAPVKGLYFFTFTTYSWISNKHVGVELWRNHEEIMCVWEKQDDGDNEDYATNSVVLQLEVGDQVWMRLPEGFYVSASDKHNVNTFTGFLLRQM